MNDLKLVIEKIYRDNNPGKVSNVSEIIEKYKGKETEMLLKLAQKYNLNLENYITVDYAQLLHGIFMKYDPENVASTTVLLNNNLGREKELIKTLSDQFHTGFNELIISGYLAGSYQKKAIREQGKQLSPVYQTETLGIGKQEGKSSKSVLIGIISIIVVFIIVGTLYFTGIFKQGSNTRPNIDQTPVNNTSNQSSEKVTQTQESKVQESISMNPINSASVSASSSMKSHGKLTYFPSNVADHNLKTWWTPSPPNSHGYNSWLKLYFGQNRKVGAVEIHNGSHFPDYPKYGNLYFKNNRLLKATLEFSNGFRQTINLREVDEIQRITFPVQVTNYIILIPLEWGRGSSWNDLCISEFAAFGE